MSFTHGVASSYPKCHAGPDGKACSDCRAANTRKQQARRARRAAGQEDIQQHPAEPAGWPVLAGYRLSARPAPGRDARPAPGRDGQDQDQGRARPGRDELRNIVYMAFREMLDALDLNAYCCPKYDSDYAGADIAEFGILLDDIGEQYPGVAWQFSGDGMSVTIWLDPAEDSEPEPEAEPEPELLSLIPRAITRLNKEAQTRRQQAMPRTELQEQLGREARMRQNFLRQKEAANRHRDIILGSD